MTTSRRFAIAIFAAASIILSWAAPALGSVHTWIGPTNGLWSNAANWSGGKPTSGESGGTIVQFGSGTTSTMDISGLSVDEIHFTGPDNTINGSSTLTINGATLVQNVVSEGKNNTLSSSLPLTLVGASLEATSSTGMLTIAGAVGGAPGMVLIGTGGEFDMTGDNTYTGPTSIQAGKLHIATLVGIVISGSSLSIGTGAGPGAELVLDQDSDISGETAIVVNKDGVMNFNGFSDLAKSLTVIEGSVLGASLTMTGALTLHAGTVTIEGILSAGSLNMAGGTIGGHGTLALAGNIEATSSAAESATVSSGVRLAANPTVTVTSGTPPEFRLTGPISETGGSRSITKAGNGTMLTSAANTYTGTTTVSAGTLTADGTQPGPFAVGPSGTLEGSGSVGATTVEGVLAPIAPGLRTGSLSFAPSARLDATINSTAAGAIPSTIVTGTVTINPNATINLVFSPGIALPHGSSVPLIENDGTDPIEGHFSGMPSGSVLGPFEGVPLLVSYGGGDDNDMTLTAGNVPPRVSSISATFNPVQAGQSVTLSVADSDANHDPLTTTWNFGDGTAGSGTSVAHAYTKAGTYTVVATASDGLAQVQSTYVITVTERPSTATTPVNTAAGGSATTSTISSSAFGTIFGLTVAHACLRPGASFTVTLGMKQRRSKSSASTLRKVTKVVFTAGGKSPKTARRSPFSAQLTVPSLASGTSFKVSAVAHLVLRNGRHHVKSVAAVIKVC